MCTQQAYKATNIPAKIFFGFFADPNPTDNWKGIQNIKLGFDYLKTICIKFVGVYPAILFSMLGPLWFNYILYNTNDTSLYE